MKKIRDKREMRELMKKTGVLVLILTLLSAGAAIPVQAQTVKAAMEEKSRKITLKDVTSATEKVTLKNTKGKDASDVAAIKELLEQLKAQGNDTVSDFGLGDLNEWNYSWSGDGKLIKLTLSIGTYGGGLKGELVLKGFKNLEELNCNDNSFSELDLGKCPKLKELYCYGNELTKLDVSNCPELKKLICPNNKLTKLDISKCPKMVWLNCYENSLTKLDISKCPKLKTLYCDNNKLTKLDISKCPKLKYLTCNNNKLKKLNAKKCPKLSDLYADKNLKISGWHPDFKVDSFWQWKRN